MYEWLQNLLPSRKRSDDQQVIVGAADPDADDSSSSNAEANAAREEKRAKRDAEEQLQDYLRLKKRMDADGDFTKKEEEQAKQEFNKQRQQDAEAEQVVSALWLRQAIENFEQYLEGSRKLVPEIGSEADVLTVTPEGIAFSPPAPQLPAATGASLAVFDPAVGDSGAWVVLGKGADEEVLSSTAAGFDWIPKPTDGADGADGADGYGWSAGTIAGQMKYWDGTDWANTNALAYDGYFMTGTGDQAGWTRLGDLDNGQAEGNILTWDAGNSIWEAQTVGSAMGLGATYGLVTWDAGGFGIEAYSVDGYGYFKQ